MSGVFAVIVAGAGRSGHGVRHRGDAAPARSGALRPAPGWAGHRTAIEGLDRTGATTRPGGPAPAGPGRNAATVMLRGFGTSLEEVEQRA